jgi:hypothetical protein
MSSAYETTHTCLLHVQPWKPRQSVGKESVVEYGWVRICNEVADGYCASPDNAVSHVAKTHGPSR